MSSDIWGNESEAKFSENAIMLATPLRRFGASLLEGLLFTVTLGIGWFIWWLVLLSRGLTPARQILGLVIIDSNTRTMVSPSQVFVRGAVVYFGAFQVISWALSFIFFGFGTLFTVVSALLVFRVSHQTLWDQITKTTVGYTGK